MRVRSGYRALCVGVSAWLLASGTAASLAAAPAVDTSDLTIRRNGYQGSVNFVTSRAGGPIAMAAPKPGQTTDVAFLAQYGPLLSIDQPEQQLILDRVDLDPLGMSHSTYQQVHRGVKVFSGTVKVHHNAAGEVLGMNGRFYPVKPTMSVVPTIDAAGAENIARKGVFTAPRAIIESSELVIVDAGWYGDAPTGARLAYQVVVTDLEVSIREALFIDAHTGKVIDRWSLIEQLLNREVHDGGGAAALPGPVARAEGQSSVGVADVDAAYDYAGDLYRYLQRGFGRDSINNAGLTLVMTPNSTAPTCPNAYWNGFQAVFCAGVATDDVVCHELTHGLTGYTAGLIYQNQSGQLNESFSDVFGEICDQLNGNVSAIGAPSGTPWPFPPANPGVDTPNNARSVCSPRPGHPDGVRWLVGEDAAAFGGAIRDMWDPTCRNHPDRANSPLETCNPNDSGGVHSGSGVPNHAFALVTDGGTFNGHTVPGIGLIKAGAVWYRALTTYLSASSDFKDAYDAFTQAANDLVGTAPNDPRTGLPGALFTAADAAAVNEAMLAVEMNTDGACGQTSTVLDEAIPAECTNPTVIFADNFEGPTFNWSVANSAPPTPYNWVRTAAALPYGRAGRAAYCEDRFVGDCSTVDESATHTMTSPAISVPASSARPYLAFTHTVGTEGQFDGGTLEISINGGPFNPISRTAIEFNPYNGQLNSAASGNTDPLAGRDAWTGFGGKWGRTIVDLSGLGVTGNSVQVRFVFGKDGCTGSSGWYVDDVSVYNCPDCDANGVADIRQYRYRASSATLGPIGTGENRSFTLAATPAAAGSVTIELIAKADLSLTTENIEVSLNGTVAGRVYELGGIDCTTGSMTPLRGSLVIPASTWNTARAAGPGNDVTVLLTGSADMNPAICNGTNVAASIRYDVAGPADANNNLVPDSCEQVFCPADFNHSGAVSVQDIFDFLAAYFSNAPAADFNHSGVVSVQDIFDFLSAYFGAC